MKYLGHTMKKRMVYRVERWESKSDGVWFVLLRQEGRPFGPGGSWVETGRGRSVAELLPHFPAGAFPFEPGEVLEFTAWERKGA